MLYNIALLTRYLHYYQRYSNHEQSLKKEFPLKEKVEKTMLQMQVHHIRTPIATPTPVTPTNEVDTETNTNTDNNNNNNNNNSNNIIDINISR